MFPLALLISQTAAEWRAKADAALTRGDYQIAADAYQRAGDIYFKLGDPNAAKVLRTRAARYRTTIHAFAPRPVGPDTRKLAPWEPSWGCYTGVNIERETIRDPMSFQTRMGRPHAMYFIYRNFRTGFPVDYARRCRDAGAALQIALEPNSYEDVRDAAALDKFAREARESGIPIFLRFAGEMNGPWTKYHGSPPRYIEMFRTVAAKMKRSARNVAMVWCPNEIPEAPIERYYPGRDAVDWVGVNFYSVPFNDADRSRDGTWRMPTDSLDYVYRKYSVAHPIMVGEWAASHRSVVDGKPVPDFAIRKIQEFHSRLPLFYPRVKAVSWLSFDAMRYAGAGRRLNDYSLLDDESVARAYSQALADPHYLPFVGTWAKTRWTPLAGRAPTGPIRIAVRTYDPKAVVTVSRDGQTRSGPPSISLELPGRGPITVTVTDSKGRTPLRKTFP